jgi:hypothetical protein
MKLKKRKRTGRHHQTRRSYPIEPDEVLAVWFVPWLPGRQNHETNTTLLTAMLFRIQKHAYLQEGRILCRLRTMTYTTPDGDITPPCPGYLVVAAFLK